MVVEHERVFAHLVLIEGLFGHNIVGSQANVVVPVKCLEINMDDTVVERHVHFDEVDGVCAPIFAFELLVVDEHVAAPEVLQYDFAVEQLVVFELQFGFDFDVLHLLGLHLLLLIFNFAFSDLHALFVVFLQSHDFFVGAQRLGHFFEQFHDRTEQHLEVFEELFIRY